jgi:glucosylceramidase
MTRARAFLAAVSLALLSGACGAGPSGTPGGGGTSGTAGSGQAGTSGDAGNGGTTSGGGNNGSAGDTGGPGASGSNGGDGSGGAAGSTGTPGAAGSTGTPGAAGSTGTPGSAGAAAGGRGGSAGGTGAAGTAGAGGRGGTAGGAAGTGGATPAGPLLFTSAPNAYWRTGTMTTVTSAADITVNDTSYQTWHGFGGSFNELGWDNLMQLSESERNRAMRLLFDAADGAHFMFGRIPIGASDFAVDRYTLNETANDYTMANFSIARDRTRLIPYIKAAVAINPALHLWASPWTPPTWMKEPKQFDGGSMVDNAQNLQALALYLAKFVQEYGKEGLTIEAIHHQNEPNYATGYPSCLWTPALYTKFIGMYLGPTFMREGVTAQIYLGTMSNADAGKDVTIIGTVLGDATAASYIKGFGMQWNVINSVSGLTSRNLPIMQTEHKCGNYPWETATFNSTRAPNDHAYAIESWGLIRDWLKTGVNSYSAWNMVLDTIGKGNSTSNWPQNALLTVDRTAKTLNVTPAYYVFRHFSQYVAPDAKRVATTGTAVDTLAFKNPDGTTTVIMYNAGSAARTTTVAIGTTRVQFSIPGSGFATLRR